MKRLLLFLAAVLCIAAPLRAVPVTPHPPITVSKAAAASTYNLVWPGLPGYTYFIQTTLNVATGPWVYCPFVENGTGTTISWDCTGPSGNPRWFLRLKYTDAPNGGDGRYADFDGDGLPNIVEITSTGTGIGTGTGTNPFVVNTLPDTDNDGLRDATEVYYFGNTTAQTGTGDADGDGISNMDEITFFGSDPTVSDDTDQDGHINDDDHRV